MNEELLINIESLNWKYGNTNVLKNIDLEFHSNKIYGLIGPNGSGKTTLLRNITRSLNTPSNTVFFKNKDLNDYSTKELSRMISYVPQSTDIEFEFSVMDIVMMGRSPHLRRFQSESKSDIDIVENAMKLTNVTHLKFKNISEVSGGERQRVIIARALAQQTELIILDEPVSQLDIHHQVEILDILKNLVSKKDITVILSLHDLNIASEYCDELVLMNSGEVFKVGDVETIITSDNINEVYGLPTLVIENPLSQKPHVIPIIDT